MLTRFVFRCSVCLFYIYKLLKTTMFKLLAACSVFVCGSIACGVLINRRDPSLEVDNLALQTLLLRGFKRGCPVLLVCLIKVCVILLPAISARCLFEGKYQKFFLSSMVSMYFLMFPYSFP